jgi:PTH2 family peptidyl-tRNA hydrolase
MDTKQVIVIRKDLKMRKGKEIAQGSHASMSFITHPLITPPLMTGSYFKFILSYLKFILSYFKFILNCIKILFYKPARKWLTSSYAKVCLQAKSEEDLMNVYSAAKAANLYAHLIIDSGRTEFHGVATVTAVAIGPDLVDKINKITGNLELY